MTEHVTYDPEQEKAQLPEAKGESPPSARLAHDAIAGFNDGNSKPEQAIAASRAQLDEAAKRVNSVDLPKLYIGGEIKAFNNYSLRQDASGWHLYHSDHQVERYKDKGSVTSVGSDDSLNSKLTFADGSYINEKPDHSILEYNAQGELQTIIHNNGEKTEFKWDQHTIVAFKSPKEEWSNRNYTEKDGQKTYSRNWSSQNHEDANNSHSNWTGDVSLTDTNGSYSLTVEEPTRTTKTNFQTDNTQTRECAEIHKGNNPEDNFTLVIKYNANGTHSMDISQYTKDVDVHQTSRSVIIQRKDGSSGRELLNADGDGLRTERVWNTNYNYLKHYQTDGSTKLELIPRDYSSLLEIDQNVPPSQNFINRVTEELDRQPNSVIENLMKDETKIYLGLHMQGMGRPGAKHTDGETDHNIGQRKIYLAEQREQSSITATGQIVTAMVSDPARLAAVINHEIGHSFTTDAFIKSSFDNNISEALAEIYAAQMTGSTVRHVSNLPTSTLSELKTQYPEQYKTVMEMIAQRNISSRFSQASPSKAQSHRLTTRKN